MTERKTVNIEQALATFPGVSRRTLYYWMATGRLQWRRSAFGTRQLFLDNIERNLAEQGVGRIMRMAQRTAMSNAKE